MHAVCTPCNNTGRVCVRARACVCVCVSARLRVCISVLCTSDMPILGQGWVHNHTAVLQLSVVGGGVFVVCVCVCVCVCVVSVCVAATG